MHYANGIHGKSAGMHYAKGPRGETKKVNTPMALVVSPLGCATPTVFVVSP